MSIFQQGDGTKAFDPRYPLGSPKNRPPAEAAKPEPKWEPVAGHKGYETDGKSVRQKPTLGMAS